MTTENFIIVEDNPTYAKNMKTGGIINRDVSMYNSRRAKLHANKQRDASIDTRLGSMENDIAELKSLLKQLVNK